MKVLVEIGHPGHVHHFKNMIWNLEKDGHEVKIVAIDKDIALNLLDAYGFCYEKLGRNYDSLIGKAFGLINADYRLFKIAKKFKPDIFVSRVSPYTAHVSRLINKPHISFCDTEHAKLNDILAYPFTDVICTPSCFKRDLGTKQVRFNGYTELAYLHPNYFKPDSSVLDKLELSKNDRFIILRFVSWSASHDIGQHGIKNKIELVMELEKYGQVFIASEGKLEEDLEKYKIKVPPENLHELLYYASLYVGDGGTTASEAAILGTPAVFVSTIVSGYLYDEEKYGLVHVFSDPKTGEEEGIKRGLELLKDNNLKHDARGRRKRLLNDKIDVTAFMVWFIENYPESFKMMKENPGMQYRFK